MNANAIKYLGISNFNYNLLKQKSSKPHSLTTLFQTVARQMALTAGRSWKTLKGVFTWHCKEQEMVHKLKMTMTQGSTLKFKDRDLIIKALSSEYFEFMQDDIAAILAQTDVETVKKIIIDGFNKNLVEDKMMNLRIFDCFDLEKLLELGEMSIKEVDFEMNQDKEFHKSRIYWEETAKPLIHTVSEEVGRFLLNLITTFARMYLNLGGSILGSSVKIKGDGISSLALPLKLLVCLAAIHWLIDTFIGYEIFIAQYALGGVVLGLVGNIILALIILYPLMVWINNHFSDLPAGINQWTNENQKAKHPDSEYVTGRQSEIGDIMQLLENKNHILLRGPLGVGKSGIVRGLSRRIVLGDVPDFLKKKTVFSLDLKKIAHPTRTAGEVLNHFISQTKRHKERVIVCIHNVDEAWKTNNNGCVQQLAKLRERYPYVIFSMTDSAFETPEIKGNNQIQTLLRYDVTPTNKNKSLLILRERSRKLNPGEVIDDSVLEQIYSDSERLESEFSQPGRAIRVLEEVLNVHRPIGSKDLLKEKRFYEQNREAIRTHAFHNLQDLEGSIKQDVYNADQKPKRDLKTILETLGKQRKDVIFLRQIRALKVSLEEAKFEQTMRMEICENEKERSQKNWLMLHKFVLPAIGRIAEDYTELTRDYYPAITAVTVRKQFKSQLNSRDS